ncbi:hypothetical protein DO021_19645 [Desulfobacter hydrogenophilus]|uniref:Phage tail protein n=1 Tax=Desulfobacter hydrogenophilus TaxID=2291 RepID=A0A328FB59_9BACT|nr:hypothetical protein [Desulfobacter hydrogenophilus]NDY73986.1 hypothetical protein [Desulfobacter hydrogenophilus]QBH14331.1 hypothetical protein EYB58_16245 [Desulfobacter hydrogenophilus]RAM00333.1 hypothetical protein DO021_19645 [Desulfobacter hydrogenophilus]
MAINGNYYDWESVEIQLQPSGVAIGIAEISYNDERPVEARYGKGAIPRGFGRKNYKASGSMTLDKDEAELLKLGLGGSFYSNNPFPVIVSYSNPDRPVIVDILPDCMITKADTSGKQDDDNVGVIKLDFIILSPIKWNGIAAYPTT